MATGWQHEATPSVAEFSKERKLWGLGSLNSDEVEKNGWRRERENTAMLWFFVFFFEESLYRTVGDFFSRRSRR